MESLTLLGIMKLLGMLAALGVGGKLLNLGLSKLPTVNVHTKYELLNKILNALGNGAEDVAKSALTHADLDGLLTATTSGTPLKVALSALLPGLEAAALAATGPATSKALGGILGDEQAGARVSQSVLSAVSDLVAAHKAAGAEVKPGVVVQLADGHLLVVPSGQQLPGGSTPVAAHG